MRSGQETPKRNLSETRSNNSAVVPIHCSSKLCSQQAPSLERQATPHAAVAHLPEAWVAAEYAHVVKHGHLSPLVGACELRARECIVPAAQTHTQSARALSQCTCVRLTEQVCAVSVRWHRSTGATWRGGPHAMHSSVPDGQLMVRWVKEPPDRLRAAVARGKRPLAACLVEQLPHPVPLACRRRQHR